MRANWTETTLGAVAEVVGGGTPTTRNPAYWDGDIVWLTPTEVVAAPGSVLIDSARKITEAGLKNSGARLLPEGTVILTSRASVGFSALAGTSLATNQGFQSLIPSPKVNNRFLMFWIQNNQQEFNSRAAGSTFKEISKANVKSISLELPPLSEQKRIVDVITSVDAYIAGLQQQADDARAARNAVLHELLTAGGDDWAETTIGATSHFVSARLSPADLDSDTPYIGLEHLNPFSAVITRSGFATNVVASVTPFEGEDVLFGRLRPYLHKVAFATFSGVCSPEILVLRALPSCAPKFLHALCSADATVKACVEMSAGTRMPRTNAGDLASINVALPPLSDQKRIVEIVAAMDAIISTTEQTVRDTQQLRSSLLSGLLSGAHEIPAAYDRLLGAA